VLDWLYMAFLAKMFGSARAFARLKADVADLTDRVDRLEIQSRSLKTAQDALQASQDHVTATVNGMKGGRPRRLQGVPPTPLPVGAQSFYQGSQE